jgi:hypothetical protein
MQQMMMFMQQAINAAAPSTRPAVPGIVITPPIRRGLVDGAPPHDASDAGAASVLTMRPPSRWAGEAPTGATILSPGGDASPAAKCLATPAHAAAEPSPKSEPHDALPRPAPLSVGEMEKRLQGAQDAHNAKKAEKKKKAAEKKKKAKAAKHRKVGEADEDSDGSGSSPTRGQKKKAKSPKGACEGSAGKKSKGKTTKGAGDGHAKKKDKAPPVAVKGSGKAKAKVPHTLKRPAAAIAPLMPQAPFGSPDKVPGPVLYNKGKIYTSHAKQGYRVLLRANFKVDKCVSWRVCGGYKKAWVKALGLIDGYESDESSCPSTEVHSEESGSED